MASYEERYLMARRLLDSIPVGRFPFGDDGLKRLYRTLFYSPDPDVRSCVAYGRIARHLAYMICPDAVMEAMCGGKR